MGITVSGPSFVWRSGQEHDPPGLSGGLLSSSPNMYDPEDDFPGAIDAISYPIRTRIFLPLVKH